MGSTIDGMEPAGSGAVRSRESALLHGGSGQRNLCNVPPLCLRAVGSRAPALHHHIAWGQWAVELLQRTASPPGGSGQCNSCNTLPHYLGDRGRCNSCICIATLLRGGGHWNSCNALPHCLGAVGNTTPVMHYLRACGRWVVELLLCTPTLSRGSGPWNSCNAVHQCMGVVGSGSSAMYYLFACGRWAVELLLCTATLLGGNGLWNSCNALPHRLGAGGRTTLVFALPQCSRAVGSGTPAMHCLTAQGQWTSQVL